MRVTTGHAVFLGEAEDADTVTACEQDDGTFDIDCRPVVNLKRTELQEFINAIVKAART